MFEARHRDVSVLVVDDHAAVRSGVRVILQNCGMQVVGEGVNGSEAVRECARLRPRIIVLDISMPVLNGFEAALQIAKLSPATKIIFLTSHVIQEYAHEASRVGGSAFVRKEHVGRRLVEAIDAALEGKTYFPAD